MKKIIYFSLFFTTSLCFCQNYTVVYNLEQVSKNYNLKTVLKTFLQGNGESSLYVEDFQKAQSASDIGGSVLNMPTENNPTYYKDLKQNSVTYNDHIRLTFFNIKDAVGKIDWKINNETKQILDYNCQQATVIFRGRTFKVFFTSDISISDGPLKFSGLPGLILEVVSDDDIASFHYLAESIKLNEKKSEVKNVYAGKDIITYEQYVTKYEQKYNEALTRIINDRGETRPMSKGFMEVLIKN